MSLGGGSDVKRATSTKDARTDVGVALATVLLAVTATSLFASQARGAALPANFQEQVVFGGPS